MKNYLFSTLITLLLLPSVSQIHAQTEKGKFLIGAESSFRLTSIKSKWKTDYNSGDDGKSISFNIDPGIGYFLFKNCAFGIYIPYSFTKEIEADEGHDYTYVISSTNILPFLRIYFSNSIFKPYLYGGVGPGWGVTKYFDGYGDLTKVPTKILSYEIGGGTSLFINKNISIDFGFGYASATSKWTDENTNMDWENKNAAIGVAIGFNIYL